MREILTIYKAQSSYLRLDTCMAALGPSETRSLPPDSSQVRQRNGHPARAETASSSSALEVASEQVSSPCLQMGTTRRHQD